MKSNWLSSLGSGWLGTHGKKINLVKDDEDIFLPSTGCVSLASILGLDFFSS